MSDVVFLRSGSNLGTSYLNFSDLQKCLEQRLDLAKKMGDLEQLVKWVNGLINDAHYTSDERCYLKRIRQRAYDRKRSINANIEGGSMNESSSNQEYTNHFDLHDLFRYLPHLGMFVIAIVVSGLLWLQSIDLYRSSNFNRPEIAATGALIMVVGFAAYYSIFRTWLALFLCFYIAGYEVYFVVSGTWQDESTQQLTRVEDRPELKLLSEKAAHGQQAYIAIKKRYDDPGSRVYQNSWFKQKELDPAWTVYESAQESYVAKRAALIEEVGAKQDGWLKILYRLGLVFLTMVGIHGLVHHFKRVTI